MSLVSVSVQDGPQGQSAPVEAWSLSTVPTVQIGDDSDVSVQFGRIASVAKLMSGEVIVADRSSMELQLFSPAGKYLKTLSRQGDGPGELRTLNGMSRVADTIFLTEGFPGPARLHAFSASGFLGRRLVQASSVRERLSPLARLADGSVLVENGRGFRVATPEPPGTFVRDTVRLGVLHGDVSDGRVAWLGEFPATSMLWYDIGPPSHRAALGQDDLGAMLVWCTSNAGIWVGDSGTGDITLFTTSGIPRKSFALPLPAITQGAIRERLQQALAEATNRIDSTRVRAVYGRGRSVGNMPVFSRFIAGPDDEVWVERWPMPGQSKHMVVLRPDRGIVATVTVPTSVTLYDIGLDYVAGSELSESGVEHAVVYRLDRHR
jgi:hypothetical protein